MLPENGSLNFDQLRNLVSHEEDLVIAKSGFDGLNTNIFEELGEIVCYSGCHHSLSDIPQN